MNNATALLDTAWKKLDMRWENSKALWRDKARRDFEQQYWVFLEKEVRATQQEIERLEHIMAKARQNIK